MHYRIGFFIILLGLASCDGFQGDSNPYQDEEITFSEHIAPIVYENCTPCHRPGEAGPFKLISHHDLAKRSKMIKEVVETRYMPPWPADKNYSTFLNEWGLAENEIQLIQAWVDQGAPIGDESKIPPRPHFPEGSMLGEPDLVLDMMPYAIEGDNSDQFIVVKIPYELAQDTFVKAIEFVPDNRKLLHHMNGHAIQYDDSMKLNLYGGKFIVKYDRSISQHLLYRELDILNDDGSYPYLTSSIVNYLPGSVNTQYPDGIGGISLKKKGHFLLKDVHYGPSPIDTTDQSSINIFFGDKKPERPVLEVMLGTLGASKVVPPLLIPPDQVKTFTTTWTVPADMSVLTLNPHMHLLGKSMLAYAIIPSNDTVPLISIPQWNFRWQFFYTFPKMVKLPIGTVIYVEAVFDNTLNNPENPFDPPRTIRERNGSMGTTDEMFQFIITYLPYEDGDENISLAP
jgi:hypothetical protein